jgi:hypothetical protein
VAAIVVSFSFELLELRTIATRPARIYAASPHVFRRLLKISLARGGCGIETDRVIAADVEKKRAATA